MKTLMFIGWSLLWAAVGIMFLAIFTSAFGQNTWNCYTIGNQTTCQGYQNGKFVTCVTTYIGNQSSTQCY